MNIIERMFAGPDTINKTLDIVASAGDKVIFTDEEKSDRDAKLKDWYIKLLDSMTPFNLAMRFLAFTVAGVWLLLVVASTSMYVASALSCGDSIDTGESECRTYIAAGMIDAQLKSHVNDPFMMIMLFYFGAAGVNGAIRTYKGGNK